MDARERGQERSLGQAQDPAAARRFLRARMRRLEAGPRELLSFLLDLPEAWAPCPACPGLGARGRVELFPGLVAALGGLWGARAALRAGVALTRHTLSALPRGGAQRALRAAIRNLGVDPEPGLALDVEECVEEARALVRPGQEAQLAAAIEVLQALVQLLDQAADRAGDDPPAGRRAALLCALARPAERALAGQLSGVWEALLLAFSTTRALEELERELDPLVGSSYRGLSAAEGGGHRHLALQAEDPRTGTRLRLIPPGSCLVSQAGLPEEALQLPLPFLLAEAPCAQAEWLAAGLQSPAQRPGPTLPVESLTHAEASLYAATQGARLPSLAELDYATRAGRSGADFDPQRCASEEQAHFDAPEQGPRPLRAGRPNAFGLYDLLGNVAEWSANGFDAPLPPGAEQRDPSSETTRTCWGGSFASSLTETGHEWLREVTDPSPEIGFRLARSLH